MTTRKLIAPWTVVFAILLLSVPPGLNAGEEPPVYLTGIRAPTAEEAAWVDENAISLFSPTKRADELPASVKNIEFLPVVGRQTLPNCGAFAPTYYMKTYQEARKRGWVRPNTRDRIMSPGIAYVFGQSDVDGAHMAGTIRVMSQAGILPLSLLPDTYLYDRTRFPSAKLLLEAMPYRSGELVQFNPRSEEGFLAIKEWLAKGELAIYAIRISQATFDYGSLPNVPEVDNDVFHGLGGSVYDWHAFTLIGYDDNKTYHDGTEEKRGALYGVNSWGVTWGIEDPDIGTRGFFWIGYDYFREGARDTYSMTERDDAIPGWVGLFEYEHPHAQQVAMNFRGGPWYDSESAASWPPAIPSTSTAYHRFTPLAVDVTGEGLGPSENYWWRIANIGDIPGVPHPARPGTAHGFRVISYEDAIEAHAGPLFNVSEGAVTWRDVPLDGIVASSIDAEGLPIEVPETIQDMRYIPAGIYDAGEEILNPPLVSSDHVFADLNLSGLPDLVAIGRTTQLYENLGGAFRRVETHGLPNAEWAGVAIGDFDRDGLPDIALCGSIDGASFTAIYRNLGDFQFQDIEAGLPGVQGGLGSKATMAWGDYVNDGLEDLAFQNHVFRNLGNGVFEPAPFQLPMGWGDVAWHDVNGNGMLDLCVGSRVFLNLGDGILSTTPLGFDGNGIWADLTGNGMPELVRLITWPSIQASIYRYAGGGALEYTGLTIPGMRQPLAAADYNNNGRMDLISGAANSSNPGAGPDHRVTAFFRQLEDGRFANSGVGMGAAMEGAMAMADLDGEGALDMLVTGWTALDVTPFPIESRLHRSKLRDPPLGMSRNTPPGPPENLSVERLADSDDFVFLWDHGTDAQTPRDSLAYNVRIGSWPGEANIVSPASCAPVTPVLRYYRIAPDQPGLILRNLPPGHYFWSVRTVDGGRMASEWAPEQVFPNLDGYAAEDFNRDGVFDVADLLFFLHLVREHGGKLPLHYDFNKDGRICQADVRTLANRLLGSQDLFPGEYSIGPEGGTVALDGLEISVPPGAFPEPAALAVEWTRPDSPYGQDATPEVYRIAGLPVMTNGPYHITLSPYEPLPEMPLVLVGETAFALGGGGRAGMRYRLLDPEILPDGRHRIEVPVLEGEDREKASQSAIQSYTMETGIFKWGYVKRVSGSYFRIYHPYHIDADQIVDLNHFGFYTAYRKLRDDYGFSYAKRTGWPVDVYVRKPSNPDESGALVTSVWGVNHVYIEINEAIMGNREKRNTTASHEFFHLAQGLYDPLSIRRQATRDKYPRWWLDEAMSTWAEELVAAPGYVPPGYVSNMEQPFVLSCATGGIAHGLNAGGKDAEQHGYGMAPLVKYLAGRRRGTILDFYQSIRNGNEEVWALRHAMPDEHIGDWYNDYFHQLVEGALYPYTNAFSTFASIAGSPRMLRLQPTVDAAMPLSWRSFDISLPDLSGAPYLIAYTADYPAPPADSVLLVRYEGDPHLGLQMFHLPRGEGQQAQRVASALSPGESKFEVIPNALEYRENLSGLLTLVTNTTSDSPYTERREGRMSLGLAQPGPFPLQVSITPGGIDRYQFPVFVSEGTLGVAYASDLVQQSGPGGSNPFISAAVWGGDTVNMELRYQAELEALSETFTQGNRTVTISTQGIDTYLLIRSDVSGAVIETRTDPTGTFNLAFDSTDREDVYSVCQVRAVYSLLWEEEGMQAKTLDMEWILAWFVFFIP